MTVSTKHACPMCGELVRVPAAHFGRQTRCRGCGEIYPLDKSTQEHVPADVAVFRDDFEPADVVDRNDPPPQSVRITAWQQARENLALTAGQVWEHRVTLIVLFGGIAAAWTFFDPPGVTRLIGYVGLIAAVYVLNQPAGRRWPQHAAWIRGAFAVLAITAVWIYHSTATYERRWISDDGYRYTDSYRRAGDVHYYRDVWKSDPFFSTEGPMSASGKPHGEWQTFVPGKTGITRQWFWYGEEISEGDWHLRNRD